MCHRLVSNIEVNGMGNYILGRNQPFRDTFCSGVSNTFGSAAGAKAINAGIPIYDAGRIAITAGHKEFQSFCAMDRDTMYVDPIKPSPDHKFPISQD